MTVDRSWLVCRIGTLLCALPVDQVIETMRPLDVDPLAGAPRFVSGVTVIRGIPVPVVNVASLLLGESRQSGRFVTVRAGARVVALAVAEVAGVGALPSDVLRDLPPLLGEAHGEAVASMGVLDAELLVILRAARLIPEDVWSAIGTGRGMA